MEMQWHILVKPVDMGFQEWASACYMWMERHSKVNKHTVTLMLMHEQRIL